MGLKRVLGAFIMAVAVIALAGLKPAAACDSMCFPGAECMFVGAGGMVCTVSCGGGWCTCMSDNCMPDPNNPGDPTPVKPPRGAVEPTVAEARLAMAGMNADDAEAYCKTLPGCTFTRAPKPARSVWARGLVAKAVR